MNAVPAVSVILPSHNRGHLLPQAVRSVLAQGWQDFELLVIDDASSDDTEAVIRSFGDTRIRYLRLTQNLGPAAARNHGIAAARGTWLAFQDSDDRWLAGKLQAQMAYAATLPERVVGIGSTLLRFNGRDVERVRWPAPVSADFRSAVPTPAIVAGGTAYLQSLLLRRSAVAATGGFDTALPVRSDVELCLRLLQIGEFVAIDLPLSLSFETAGGVSLQQDKRIDATQRIMARHAEVIAAAPGARSQWLCSLARVQLLHDRRLALWRTLSCALACEPGRGKTWALLGLSLLPKTVSTWALARLTQGKRV